MSNKAIVRWAVWVAIMYVGYSGYFKSFDISNWPGKDIGTFVLVALATPYILMIILEQVKSSQ